MASYRRRGGIPLAIILFLYLIISSQPLDFDNLHKSHRKIQGPIKTVVVLIMENRSFDHILGWLKSTRPDIDGLTGKESNSVNISDPKSPKVFVSDDAIFVDSDPGHSFQAIHEQIFGSNVISPNSAPMMNGFVQQAMSMDPDMARTVMSGFKPEVIPIYTELANEFAVFDRWFASVPSSTQPNRFYVHSATSHGCQSNVKKDLIHGFPQKTIFDSVDENGLTFGIYYQNIPATLFFKSLRKLKHLTKFHSYGLKFKRHARLGKLPNYAVIEQRYFDVSLFPANDDHPSHDVAAGQRFVKEVYETLRSSPQWNEMAFLITYDEHGGFFDHVPTPVSHVPSPDGVIGPDPFFFRFDRLGVRVPTLLISPWIDKGTGKSLCFCLFLFVLCMTNDLLFFKNNFSFLCQKLMFTYVQICAKSICSVDTWLTSNCGSAMSYVTHFHLPTIMISDFASSVKLRHKFVIVICDQYEESVITIIKKNLTSEGSFSPFYFCILGL